MNSIPAPGHLWVDTDCDESGSSRRLDIKTETLLLLRPVSNSKPWSPPAWEMLVTRSDGSTYVDWENIESVEEWYKEQPAYLKRIV